MAEREIKTTDYLEKVYKLIPVEVTGAYIAGSSIIASQPNAADLWHILIGFGILLFLINPFFLKRVQSVTNTKQLAISTLSFPIWAANCSIEWFSGAGSIALILALGLIVWTLLIPIAQS